MNFLNFVKENYKFWNSVAPMLDSILTTGIDDTFTRAEREMIFAYISEDNGCDFCAKHHSDLAYSLGFDDNFTKDNFADGNVDKERNIRYIVSCENLVNDLVDDFNITQVADQDIMLSHTFVKHKGYSV